jgi:hypothetical protein
MSYLALAKQARALGRAHVSGLGAALDAGTPGAAALLANFLPMPLREFAHRGAPIAVRVPWYTDILWFVPSEAEVVLLERDGVQRGRIWTAAELLELLSLPRSGIERVITLALAKLEFRGDIVMVTSVRHVDPQSLREGDE